MIVLESKLAKKYAAAFLNVYEKECTPEYIETLKKLSQFIHTNKLFQAVLNVPSLTSKEKNNIVEIVSKKFALKKSVTKLMLLLLKDKRIDMFGEVLKKILLLYRKKQKEHHFKIATSHELTIEEKKKITRFVETLVKTNISTVFFIDTSLISGIKIIGNTFLWERSIAKQLREVEQNILRREEI